MGVAGPAMIAGAGLGDHSAEEIGPIDMMATAGVVDVVVEDEADAVRVVKQLTGLLSGAPKQGPAADQSALRQVLPDREKQAYDVRPIITTLADLESVVFLRQGFAPELVTAFGRIEGRSVGFLANQTLHMAGSPLRTLRTRPHDSSSYVMPLGFRSCRWWTRRESWPDRTRRGPGSSGTHPGCWWRPRDWWCR